MKPLLAFVELAAFAAVEEVDEQADDQPDEEADPGDGGEAGHQEDAEEGAQDRDDRAEGDAEAAVTAGIFGAEDDDADGDQNEGEECADVRHFGEGADVEEA